MDEVLTQNANVILDIECLAQTLDKCSGSPKMTKALSRKGSSRMEKKSCEETDPDESPRKLVVKVTNLQVEPLKQPVIYNKYPNTISSTTINPTLTDNNDGKIKKLNRFGSLRPRKILLIFASLSSMGTLILIYFTLAIHRTS